VHGTFVPKNFTVTHFTSYKITSHKSGQFIPHHSTYLHTIPTTIPLLVTTFLTSFPNIFSLQGKDASKPAANWFQFLMVLFTKEYLPASVLFFLVLIFRLRSSLLRYYGFRSALCTGVFLLAHRRNVLSLVLCCNV
jgi:hypothetical protein